MAKGMNLEDRLAGTGNRIWDQFALLLGQNWRAVSTKDRERLREIAYDAADLLSLAQAGVDTAKARREIVTQLKGMKAIAASRGVELFWRAVNLVAKEAVGLVLP